MDDIANLAADAVEGLTVIADEQTHGRGRANRRWHAAPGSSLLFSTLLRPDCSPERFQVFPLLAGLAVAESIERCCGVRAGVKWPNDVLIDGRKVAGLLVTSRVTNSQVETAILGVGVNLIKTPDNLATGAIALEDVADQNPDAEVLLNEMLGSICSVYRDVIAGDTRTLLERWLERAVYLRERVEVVDGERCLVGRFSGVSESGGLVLQTGADTYREVHAGDLVRGPVRPGNRGG